MMEKSAASGRGRTQRAPGSFAFSTTRMMILMAFPSCLGLSLGWSSGAQAQTVTIPSSTTTVQLQTLSPGSVTFDAPSTTTVNVSSGDGITGDASQDWVLTNEGAITGSGNGVSLSSLTVTGARFDNFGTVTGTADSGVRFLQNGAFYNHAGAVVTGGATGVYTTTANSSVTNDGQISSGQTSVYMLAGGVFTQNATGTITGNDYGFILDGGTLSASNAGSISTLLNAVTFRNSSTFTFTNTGSIASGSQNAVLVTGGASGTFINNSGGTLTGADDSSGINVASDSGPVQINNSGTISGVVAISAANGGNTITNTGTLTSSAGVGGTAVNISGANNSLILGTGSVINGLVVSQVPGNTITLQGTGSEDSDITGFDTMRVQATAGQTWTLSGTVSMTGAGLDSTNVQTGKLVITGSLLHTTAGGGTTIFASADESVPTVLQIGDGGTTGTLTGDVVANDSLIFNRSDNITFGYNVIGTGIVTNAGTGTTTFTANLLPFHGVVVQSGGVRITGDANIGTVGVNIQPNAMFSVDGLNTTSFLFDNALSGEGTFKVNMTNPTDIFSFGFSTGNVFTGLIELQNSQFNLSGFNTSSLSLATLQLDAGNTTTVGMGKQSIGNLAMNGGQLNFGISGNAPTGTVAVNTLTLASGKIGVDLSGSALGSLLQQDEGLNNSQLISATTVIGSASNLTLVDSSTGNAPSPSSNIVQGGNVVAVGSYNSGISSASTGLFLSYQLLQLALQAGQTLSLSGDSTTPAGANELHAKLTGSGNLAIDATTSITLNNTTNDYAGNTTVDTGSLILGSDNALGATALLTINSGATTDLNGKTQTVSSLGGAGTLNVNAGNLTLGSGGTFGGVISGSTGALTLTGGTLTLTGSNTYSGGMTINSGATLQIGASGTTGSYASPATIVDNGSLIVDRSDALLLALTINGTGSFTKNGTGALTLNGSSGYTGATNVNAGALLINGVLSGTTSTTVASGATLGGGGFDYRAGQYSQWRASFTRQ